MTINKEKLISLLVEKTEQDREQVEEQLSELIGRIQKAAGEGKSFEIEGFGTFTMQDDMLHFEPSDRLETEINNRYAGMKPIELIGAFKEPDGGEIPDVSVSAGSEEDNDIWGIDKEPGLELEESEEDPAVFETSDTEEEEVEEKEPATQELYNRAESILTEKQTAVEEMKPEPAVQLSSKDDEKDKSTKEADPIGRFLVAAVVVLSIGIGGWFIYDFGLIGGGNSTTNDVSASPPIAQQQESSTDRADVVPDDESPQAGENSPGSEEEELISEEEVTNNVDNTGTQEENEDSSPYGLYGTANSEVTGGYTIVVHSLRQQQKAAAMRDRLNEEGYRTVLSEASINGETYYRIGIGQFENVANAQKAAAGLPDNFKNNHFIRRI